MSHHILIYGYGREGQSTETFLYAHHYPEIIDIYDAKTHPIELKWDEYDQIWISPGVDPRQIPVAHHPKITSQADYFFSNLSEAERRKVIAITGSKGKTTTTQTLTHTLQTLGQRAQCAGNLGTPLLDVLPPLKRGELDYVVAEISSFQAQFIQRAPHTVIFLNLFGDHLDRHGDKTQYLAAKAQLWANQKPGDHLIVPAVTMKTLGANPQLINPISAPALSTETYPLKSILNAAHFRENLGTISVVLDQLGLKWTPEILQAALESVPLPDHRLQFVAEKRGFQFYDDAIGSNPTATMAAVRHFGTNLGWLILGGKSSGDDPAPLLRLIEEIAPQAKIMITKSEFSTEVARVKSSLNITVVNGLEDVFTFLPTNADKTSGSVVLLSPAAKSFDQYPKFEVKGDHFKTLVAQLDS